MYLSMENLIYCNVFIDICWRYTKDPQMYWASKLTGVNAYLWIHNVDIMYISIQITAIKYDQSKTNQANFIVKLINSETKLESLSRFFTLHTDVQWRMWELNFWIHLRFSAVPHFEKIDSFKIRTNKFFRQKHVHI